MNFDECLKKCDMYLNRVHSTARLIPLRVAIQKALDTPEDDIPNIVDSLVGLITTYCVSETEVNMVKKILYILSELEEHIIHPLDLIDGE